MNDISKLASSWEDDRDSVYAIANETKVQVVPDKEMSHEDYIKELDEILRSIEEIKEQYYALDASVERVRSRTFNQIVQSYLTQVINRIISKTEVEAQEI